MFCFKISIKIFFRNLLNKVQKMFLVKFRLIQKITTFKYSSFATMEKQTPLWNQKTITLKAHKRGCHLITSEITSNLPELKNYKVGLLNLFLQHTSASLCLNENYDSDVRLDMEDSFNRIVPENNKLYRHTIEGSDDMPAHIKSALVGASITIPITDGALNLGTWQGVWLCEHRDGSHTRNIVATINGAAK